MTAFIPPFTLNTLPCHSMSSASHSVHASLSTPMRRACHRSLLFFLYKISHAPRCTGTPTNPFPINSPCPHPIVHIHIHSLAVPRHHYLPDKHPHKQHRKYSLLSTLLSPLSSQTRHRSDTLSPYNDKRVPESHHIVSKIKKLNTRHTHTS